VAFVSHACRLSSCSILMEAPKEVEVEPHVVEEVCGDPVSFLVAAGRVCMPSISANQSFSAMMSVAASIQFQKSE